MTTTEFSSTFDVFWDSIRANNSSTPSINEYEKSVWLTAGQDELIKNYANPKGNKYGEGVDGSPKRLMDFSSLIETFNTTTYSLDNSIDPRSKIITVNGNVFLPLNESCVFTIEGKKYNTMVDPITFAEYSAMSTKQYFQPPKRVTWALMRSGSNTTIELIPHSKYANASVEYTLRYIRKARPIILEDIIGGSIDGLSVVTECELNSGIHMDIIKRAVVLAENALTGNLNTDLQLEQRAE